MHRYPTLAIKTLRGNVNTRLRKLDDGDYDAIILAAAGLERLGLGERIRQRIPAEVSLPAVGQGVMGVECRIDDPATARMIAPLQDPDARVCVDAERAMNAKLEGGCQVPIAGFAEIVDGRLHLRGRVGSPDGSVLLRAGAEGTRNDAGGLGDRVARELFDQGAKAILDAVYEHA